MVDFLSGCFQENTLESPPTIKLEENLLDGTKVEKVNTQAKGYEEALGVYIPTNQGLDMYFNKGGKFKNNKVRLRTNKN